MSKRKTSPSSSFAQRRASSPPMLPAPMRPIFLRVGIWAPVGEEDLASRWPKSQGPTTPGVRATSPLHLGDERVAELGAFDLGGALHQAGEVVSHSLGPDGAVHALDDEIRRLLPSEVAQHHLAAEDDRARVHLVEVGVLGGRAMGRLED